MITGVKKVEIIDKLDVLADAAKYDVACTSSGVDRSGAGKFGSCVAKGICHSFATDGRCISLLKILLTNVCRYDCQYCVNRVSNDLRRTTFTPREIADLTINFYKRNYIEGLFLSSAIPKNPDHTMEQLIETLSILRNEYGFNGYIHAKAIPGCSEPLVERLGMLADRMSVNIELPSERSLNMLCPQKSKPAILKPMGMITSKITENKEGLVKYRSAKRFVPAGQSTQMIIGATPETDQNIMKLSEGLYKTYGLRRVFYSAYIPVSNLPALPKIEKPPLLREHRLYQADWLIRFYQFRADELFTDDEPNLDPLLDPKCGWALRHIDQFPIEINRADYETLLRVPGIGVKGAKRILAARRYGRLDFAGLKKLGIVLKRARYFITCNGKMMDRFPFRPSFIRQNLVNEKNAVPDLTNHVQQLSWMDSSPLLPSREDHAKCLSGQM